MTYAAVGIMARLREATRELHDRAERHPFQRDLATGNLPRESYAEMLGQLFHVHGILEAQLRIAARADGEIGRVVRDYQFKEELLREDVAFFGLDVGEMEPVEATAALTEGIREAGEVMPRKLLGYHYVLEGSTNGGRIVAGAVRRAFGLAGAAGTHYLDPYGALQAERWSAFKRDMGDARFSESEMCAMVDAAREMFEGIVRISDELHTRHHAALAG